MDENLKVFIRTIKQVGIYILDLAFAFSISEISFSDVAHEFLRFVTGVSITLIGGSGLFILQQTLLPMFADWMNNKIQNKNQKQEENGK